jgi:hypothetical protein
MPASDSRGHRTFRILAPLVGAFHCVNATEGLRMAATSGYCLATLQVASRHEPEGFKGSSRGMSKVTPPDHVTERLAPRRRCQTRAVDIIFRHSLQGAYHCGNAFRRSPRACDLAGSKHCAAMFSPARARAEPRSKPYASIHSHACAAGTRRSDGAARHPCHSKIFSLVSVFSLVSGLDL